MSLLREIQEAVVKEGSDISPILLKLRLLAARLGSEPLEDWVKYESEGYPNDVKVPSYRIIGVSYRDTFSGPFGSGIKNAPIPPYLIEKIAGKKWTHYEFRDGIAALDELVSGSSEGGSLHIDASNLIILLQGKVYEGYACNEIVGTISRAALAEIQYAVRSRILELTLRLEKSVPEAARISFGAPKSEEKSYSEEVTKISNQVIYGNVTNITAGDGSQLFLSIGKGDKDAFVEYLSKSGISESDAKELAEIVAAEQPTGSEEPFGDRAKSWILENLKKAADGTWKVSISVATKVLTEAALRYYGLK